MRNPHTGTSPTSGWRISRRHDGREWHNADGEVSIVAIPDKIIAD
jgi:hypothetical protein